MRREPSHQWLLHVFQPQYVTVSQLHSYIDPNQLTEELGGSLQYSHRLWLHNRLVRHFQRHLCARAGSDVFTQILQEPIQLGGKPLCRDQGRDFNPWKREGVQGVNPWTQLMLELGERKLQTGGWWSVLIHGPHPL